LLQIDEYSKGRKDKMNEESKMLGKCPGCDEYGSLTMQHVRLVTELEGMKIPLCINCHRIVTRYEDEVLKAIKHINNKE
jgi:hypothetical protein